MSMKIKLPIENQPKQFVLNADWGDEHFDDLNSAIESNPLDRANEIKEIVVEFPGENDSASWWWVVKMRDGTYQLITGWCDYTGWDCQSGVTSLGFFKTVEDAINAAPEFEEYHPDRRIREVLTKQLNNELVFGTY